MHLVAPVPLTGQAQVSRGQDVFTTVVQVFESDHVTWHDVVAPEDEPTAISPPLITEEPPPRRSTLLRTAKGSSGSQRRCQIGKYELREKLGRGSFGVVYLARDPSLDRDTAIKVLRPKHLSNRDIVQRFLQEARATARIAHPGIVTIYDCGLVETTDGPTAFIAMELLSGESLTSRLSRSGRLDPASAAEIARQVASALEAAHRVHVLHRDLKPDNIYLVPDPAMPNGERVKILDFGLAKLGQDGHTQVQNVFGTPRYMSPEQCRSSAQVDHRSDIYSLGCILFELVAGIPPFDGDVRRVIDRHQHAVPPRARSLAPGCPPALDELIAEMLAKAPLARPQSMGAVQRALLRATTDHAAAAEVTLPTPPRHLMLVPPQHLAHPAPAYPPLAPVPDPAPAPRDVAISGEMVIPAFHAEIAEPTTTPGAPPPAPRAPTIGPPVVLACLGTPNAGSHSVHPNTERGVGNHQLRRASLTSLVESVRGGYLPSIHPVKLAAIAVVVLALIIALIALV